MPELPEVETTLRGVLPYLSGALVASIQVREPRLRWPVSNDLGELTGQRIRSGRRRAKYLLFETEAGTLMIHLGMSGSLRISNPAVPLGKHDHVIIHLESGLQLRYHDPRRFGCVLWLKEDPSQHALLRDLGPEPLGPEFSAAYLYHLSRRRRSAVKTFIMNAKVAVGVGNIYACESLFMAGIAPERPAGDVEEEEYQRLVEAIQAVLQQSIQMGGTTLRDFVREDGRPGYFQQTLRVYGQEGRPCPQCAEPIIRVVLGQRSTFYCKACQQ